jgi:PAS domain S-box-containing protein
MPQGDFRVKPTRRLGDVLERVSVEPKDAVRASRSSADLLEGQNEALERVVRGAPLPETLDRLLRVIEAQCPGMLCSILLLDPDGLHVHPVAGPSLPDSFNRAIDGQPIGPRAGSCGTAAFRREAVIVEDIATDPLWDDYRAVALAHDLRACWSTPLVDAQRRVLGTFALYFRTPGRPTDFHRRLIEVSTRTAAIAIVHDRESRELRASEERLRLAVTGGNVGIWEWDFALNRLVWNDELILMWGWPPGASDLTLQNVMSMVLPEDRPLIEAALTRSVREGTACEVEYRVRRHDDSIRWIATKGRAEYDAANRPVRMMGVAVDITDRKHAEDQVRRSEERFQLVARATNDAIWDWDLASDKVWWNQGITTLFEYSAADVGPDAGWRSARVHPEDRDRVVASIRAVMDQGQPFWSKEYRFRRANGWYADVFDRGFVIYDSKRRPIRMIGAMADISERKRAFDMLEQRVATRTTELQAKNQELEQEVGQRKRVVELLRARNEELKAFAYTVSHDLKAPLRGIAGYAQELDRQHRAGLGERGLWCLRQILTATRNLDRLIEDLLHYSRLDAQTPTATEIDLAAMVEAILKDRRPVIAAQRTEVTVNLTATRVHAWERGLLQVLTNLIDNAIKYSRNVAQPAVRIGSEDRSDHVRITVADNGIGFDMKYHDRIFGLFNRLVRQEDFEGTGAGLAIVKKVIEKIGGSVRAESSPGAGSVFFVDLPAPPRSQA